MNFSEKTKDINFEEQTFISKLKNYFYKGAFKVSVFDIAIAGIFLSLNIATSFIKKFTIMRVIPIQIEFIFYMFYGLVFGIYKGAFLALLADTLSLLVMGGIGMWYWVYAIQPPLIAIISSLYFFFFKETKYFKLFMPLIIFIAAFTGMMLTYIFHSSADGMLKLNNSKKHPEYISSHIVLYFIIGFLLMFLVAGISFLIIYFKTKKDKYLNYYMIFSLITFIIIIFRWILGPISYISFYNYFYAKNSFKSVGKDYIIILVPILIKTIIVIPVYVVFLTPTFSVVTFISSRQNEILLKSKW
ncbi:ECF transporter S component [Mycoplasma sp. Mirounga ES2805-ORL]|uniref:ECF transporter S component n=1 Tax=Mycoplasma sp. Mirounga ES2805-ORL TaxID=754514 RepID=UPI00197C7CE7|nr:ECF transporter S component [Mycoplasma sp. Mirounga ES2805-ORL]QSF13586.1 hypothetical protein JXZ90_02890 [Mycoplasma sp. Mirounga ES2805-ORL]